MWQDPAEFRHNLAAAKLVGGLQHLARESVGVEPNSVYGAAVLMPQLARSLGWPKSMVELSLSAWAHYAFCLFLHVTLLMFIEKGEKVITAFGGQMFLCEFGKDLDACAASTGGGCRGPCGTRMTPPRLYAWNQFATRTFVRDTLQVILPSRVDEIQSAMDPGEYGLESNACRLICCLVFVVSCVQELDLVFRMFRLIFYIPTKNESWIELSVREEETTSLDDAEHLEDQLKEVRVVVRGMSLFWKVFNSLFVVTPKVFLWWFTATAGVNMLMETSSINDVIVNSVALNFLLSFDELITDALMTKHSNFLLDKCEDYHCDDGPHGAEHSSREDRHLIQKLLTEEHRNWLSLIPHVLTRLIHKLLLTFALCAFLLHNYFVKHCVYRDGHWVSIPFALPKKMAFTFWNAFFPAVAPIATEDETLWAFPEDS